MNILVHKQIYDRLESYLKTITVSGSLRTDTIRRAYEKHDNVLRFIKSKFQTIPIVDTPCPYPSICRGLNDVKMVTYIDKSKKVNNRNATKWVIAYRIYNEDTIIIVGLDTEQALANKVRGSHSRSSSRRVNCNHILSIQDYITEQIHNTTYNMKSLQQYINEKMSEEISTEDLNKTTDVDNETNKE